MIHSSAQTATGSGLMDADETATMFKRHRALSRSIDSSIWSDATSVEADGALSLAEDGSIC